MTSKHTLTYFKLTPSIIHVLYPHIVHAVVTYTSTCVQLQVYNVIYIIFTRQVDDNPTNGPDKSTKKILVDESTT